MEDPGFDVLDGGSGDDVDAPPATAAIEAARLMSGPSSPSFDLSVENGILITPRGRRRANLYVSDGKVALITDQLLPVAERLDAKNLFVMPGMVDTHVHFMDPGASEREDFPSGTAAAAKAGVTTVIEHSHVFPVRNPVHLEAKVQYLEGRSYVDFGLAAHGTPGDVGAAVAALEAGAAFVKIFTCTTHGIEGHSSADVLRLFNELARVKGICLAHCEDGSLLDAAEKELMAAGRTDGAVVYEWRTRAAERIAVEAVADLAYETGAAVVIAHASGAEVVEICGRYRSLGARVVVESCPQYFVMLEHEATDLGALRKFTPPARARGEGDLAAMWQMLAAKQIDLISSDHAPSTIQQKRDGSIWDVHFGLPGIDTTLPLLADAAQQSLITYERLVEVYSEQPARTYGFYPQKGCLEVGADADFVLLDPERKWVITDEEILSKAKWSPYSGHALKGRPVATYLRGRPVSVDGKAVAEPRGGRYIPGPGLRN